VHRLPAMTVTIPKVCGMTSSVCRYADLNQVTKDEYKKHDNTGKFRSLASLGRLKAVPFSCDALQDMAVAAQLGVELHLPFAFSWLGPVKG